MNTIDSESQEQFHVSSVRYFPEEWDNKTLLDAVGMKKDLIVAGPFGSNLKVSDYKDEGIPIIRLQNIDYGKFIDKEIKYISHEKARELAYHSFRAGDLVLAKLGDPIGKTCIVPDYFKDGIVVADVVRVRVADGLVDKKFIMYSLNSVATKNQLINGTIGSTRPRVNLDQIRDIQILVPPLNEQRKIAAILSSVDAAIEQTDAIIAQTERMKTGLMQELFAKKFDIAKLGDCSFKPEYGYTTSAIFQPVGPKFIRITDLKDDGVDWASVPHCTCDEYVLKKYLLKPGDIIFARIGATTGKNYLIKENINCIFASYLIRIRCKDMLLPDFLYQFLKTSAYWNQINANKSGRLKEGINIPLLNGILIPLPSIQEQKKISLILSSIDERLDGEKKYRERLKKLKLGLMQDLLNGRVRVKVDGNV
ncbi:MAG: Type-1 restriction enzyme MjaXIP specificity protein [Methanosaeta sp. PtaB.Bin039]|jgi:type I restriction enzyme S subunit|nr:MAG: Type-1 restriction enzyme MjaXIP specificity protein [Methanosaeta sp. PtaB.Bin039]